MMFKWEERSRAVNLLYNQGQVILAASWIAMISIKVNGLTLTLVLEHQCLNQSLLQNGQPFTSNLLNGWCGDGPGH